MAFPSHALEAVGGEISCHVFENVNIGLRRNLFWTVTIKFAPIRYAAQEWSCSMTCDWIVWPFRSWKQLDGQELEIAHDDRGVECSFYLAYHHVGQKARMSLRRNKENVFRVVMDMIVEFGGVVGDDADAFMPVHAEALLPFTALSLVFENLFPKPKSIEDATAVVSQYLDVHEFHEPERTALGFRFRPRD